MYPGRTWRLVARVGLSLTNFKRRLRRRRAVGGAPGRPRPPAWHHDDVTTGPAVGCRTSARAHDQRQVETERKGLPIANLRGPRVDRSAGICVHELSVHRLNGDAIRVETHLRTYEMQCQ